jgi:hypothetical protein
MAKQKRTFKGDLVFGRCGEKRFTTILESYGFECLQNTNKNILELWDVKIEVNGFNFSFEVKFDMLAKTTRNVAIEYYNPKKNSNSGISATNADFWVFVFDKPPEIYLAGTQQLRQYIDKNASVRDVFGGDNNSYMKLFNKEKILSEVFVRIDNLQKDEFVNELINRRE